MSSDITVRSDQWDIRLNIKDEKHVSQIIDTLTGLYNLGNVRYVHCSNVEYGDVSGRSSYNSKHVHIALVLHNYTSKSSILRKVLVPPKMPWYCQPRDKAKPISGWIEYHSKERSKVNPEEERLLLVLGTLPRDRKRITPEERVELMDEKKEKKFKEWQRKKHLMLRGQWDDLDYEYPGFIYSSLGQSMKREIMKQSNDEFCRPIQGDLRNYIIFGPSGSGKSSSIALLYPNCYKKQKGSQYWDGYDKTNPDHSVVWIDEMSKETLATLTGKIDGGFEFLKELGDRYPVTVDEKYTKGYKIRPRSVIITMNEHPTSLLPERAVAINKAALYRKFKILHVEDWLLLNGLKNTFRGAQFISELELKQISDTNGPED